MVIYSYTTACPTTEELFRHCMLLQNGWKLREPAAIQFMSNLNKVTCVLLTLFTSTCFHRCCGEMAGACGDDSVAWLDLFELRGIFFDCHSQVEPGSVYQTIFFQNILHDFYLPAISCINPSKKKQHGVHLVHLWMLELARHRKVLQVDAKHFQLRTFLCRVCQPCRPETCTFI